MMREGNISDIQIVRYEELEPCFDAFIDTRTPGSDQKENFTIIGPGVSENPSQHVHIKEPHGFNVGGARQPPGCINSQHSHNTAEFFFVHSGHWSFNLGEDGKDAQVTLQPGDAISIPTRVFRGFENVGEDTGFLWALLGGDDPGQVLWAPYVFDMASEYGLKLLENGSLIDTAKGEKCPANVPPMPVTTQQQVDEMQILGTAALRKCCVQSADDVPSDSGEGWSSRKIVHSAGQLSWPHEFAVEEYRIEAGASVDLGKCSQHQVMFSHAGTVTVSTEQARQELSEGDTATIACSVTRNIANTGGESAIILVVTATEE